MTGEVKIFRTGKLLRFVIITNILIGLIAIFYCFCISLIVWEYSVLVADGHDKLEIAEFIKYGPIQIIAYAIIWPVLFIYSVYCMRSNIFEAKRYKVILEQETINITDWQSRQTTVPLSSIQEIRAIDWGSITAIDIKADGKMIKFSRSVEHPRILLDEIISRAGLVKTRSNWHSTWYGRPEGQADVKR